MSVPFAVAGNLPGESRGFGVPGLGSRGFGVPGLGFRVNNDGLRVEG
jgi:hypothetical protein